MYGSFACTVSVHYRHALCSWTSERKLGPWGLWEHLFTQGCQSHIKILFYHLTILLFLSFPKLVSPPRGAWVLRFAEKNFFLCMCTAILFFIPFYFTVCRTWSSHIWLDSLASKPGKSSLYLPGIKAPDVALCTVLEFWLSKFFCFCSFGFPRQGFSV